MKLTKKFKGAFRKNTLTTHWGQHLTGDHITGRDNQEGWNKLLSITGDKSAFTVQDIHTRLKHLYPQPTKGAKDTKMSLKHFTG